jgi:hypothetical protein
VPLEYKKVKLTVNIFLNKIKMKCTYIKASREKKL